MCVNKPVLCACVRVCVRACVCVDGVLGCVDALIVFFSFLNENYLIVK